METFADGILSTIIYAALGIALSGVGFLVVDMVMPGDLRKQLAEEGHIALAIVSGAFVLGISIIIAASIV